MNKTHNQSKLILLTSIFASSLVISNVVATKLWIFGMLVVPAGIVAYPITFLMTDIIGEVWGKKTAATTVFVGFVCSIIALVIGKLAVMLPAAVFYEDQAFFARMFGTVGRITVASLAAYIVSQTTDVWLFHWIREKTSGKHLWLRNNVATIISQLFDTIIFIVIAFVGLVPTTVLGGMVLGQWIVKSLLALLDTPFCYLLVAWSKRGNE